VASSVTLLSAPDVGFVFGEATAINASGQISGWYYVTGTEWSAVRWDDSASPVELDWLDATHEAYGFGLNDAGVVIGASNVFPVRWDGATVTALDDDNGDADAINGDEQIGGHNAAGLGAVWWDAAAPPIELAELDADDDGRAWGVNVAGDFVGTSKDDASADTRAVAWPGAGAPVELDVPGGVTSSTARGINSDGQIAGYVIDTRNTAATWVNSAASITLLDDPDVDWVDSLAFGINSEGLIVGQATDADSTVWAIRWNADGTLNEILPQGSDGTFSYAYGINSGGAIVGAAYNADFSSLYPVAWNLTASGPDGYWGVLLS